MRLSHPCVLCKVGCGDPKPIGILIGPPTRGEELRVPTLERHKGWGNRSWVVENSSPLKTYNHPPPPASYSHSDKIHRKEVNTWHLIPLMFVQIATTLP